MTTTSIYPEAAGAAPPPTEEYEDEAASISEFHFFEQNCSNYLCIPLSWFMYNNYTFHIHTPSEDGVFPSQGQSRVESAIIETAPCHGIPSSSVLFKRTSKVTRELLGLMCCPSSTFAIPSTYTDSIFVGGQDYTQCYLNSQLCSQWRARLSSRG